MPRNTSGNYTLPLPPVVSGTIIEADWANTTLQDIASSLTDSLDRNGRGGLVFPFRLVDGSASTPALSFTTETNSGLYKASPGVLGMSILGTAKQTWTSVGTQIAGNLTVTGTTTHTGDFTVTGAITVTGDLTVDGNAVVNGDFQADYIESLGVVTAGTDFLLNNNRIVGWDDSSTRISGNSVTDVFTITTNSLERFRVGPDGKVGIGAAGSIGLLDVVSNGGGVIVRSATQNGTVAHFGTHNTVANALQFFVSNNLEHVDIHNARAGNLRFYTNSLLRFRIDEVGNLALSDTTTPPTSGLNYLYAEGGILKWRSGGAVITPIAPSDIKVNTNFGINVGQTYPALGIGLMGVTGNIFLINHDTAVSAAVPRTVNVTTNIQRFVNVDEGLSNPKALRVATVVNVDTAQTEWAISGELTNKSNTSSTGNCAVSGVATKEGLAPVFGGHFQAKDRNDYPGGPTTVTSAIGCEMNVPARGLDHPTLNEGLGARVVLDLIGRAELGPAFSAEIGMGLRVRSDNLTQGYLRYGISVMDGPSNPNPVGTAIFVKTGGTHGLRFGQAAIGGHTTADILAEADSANGIILNGSYTGSAIRIASNQYLSFDTAGTVKMRYESAANKIQFYVGGVKVGHIDLTLGDHVF